MNRTGGGKSRRPRPRILLVAPLLRLLPPAKRGRRARALLQTLNALGEVLLLSTAPSEDARGVVLSSGTGGTALVCDDAVALADRAAAAVAESSCDFAVFLDGGAARAALDRVASLVKTPTVLAIFPDDYPAAWPRSACSPDQLWCFCDEPPVLGTEGLVPRRFHWRSRPDRGWIELRVAELLGGREPERAQAHAKRELSSLVVPCWNALPHLKECLESVKRWTRPPYEIVVVDNGSAAPTRRFLERWRPPEGVRFRLIRNARNLGFAKAVNQGMKAARGRYLVWLNTDVVVMPHWLDRLIDCARRAPWIGAVGPMTNQRPHWAKAEPSFPAARAPLMAEVMGLKNAGRAFAASRLQGFCLLLKREAFERVGLLDERFGRAFFEDYDYCLRLRQAGYELAVAEDVFVHHHWHRSLPDPEQRGRHVRLNRQVWIEKWCRRALEFVELLNEQDLGAEPAQMLRRDPRLCVQQVDVGRRAGSARLGAPGDGSDRKSSRNRAAQAAT